MKQLFISFSAVLLLGFALTQASLAKSLIWKYSGGDPSIDVSWEPSNSEIQSLASKIYDTNKHLYQNAKRVPVGAIVKIPLTTRDTLVEMKDYRDRGDGHDCYWWTAQDVLVAEHQKLIATPVPFIGGVTPSYKTPVNQPAQLSKFAWELNPHDWEFWVLVLALVVFIAIWIYLLREYLRNPHRFPPVVAGGLNGMNAEQALNTIAATPAYTSGPRPIRAQWGFYRRLQDGTTRSMFIILQMLTGNGKIVPVNIRENQRVLRVWFSPDNFRDYLQGCANMAYFSEETHLPTGWEWVAETTAGAEHVVPQPPTEAPAPVVEHPVQTTEPAPVTTAAPASPFKEPLDLQAIIKDPRVTFVHIKQGDTEVKIDLKGKPGEPEKPTEPEKKPESDKTDKK